MRPSRPLPHRSPRAKRCFRQLPPNAPRRPPAVTRLERLIRDLAERRQRLDRQLADATGELDAINERLSGLDDPAEKREAVEAAEIAVEDATIAAEDVEAVLSAARSAELMARGPVEAARSALNALETEARTISKMLAAGATAGISSRSPT